MIGKTLGQYSIEALIGHGGMGSVYRGVNKNIGLQVAVKVLHPHLASVDAIVDRFCKEAEIQARLEHPNIVRVYDFFKDGGVLAIVMEYARGYTFEKLLEENGGPIEPKRVIELFLPLLKALEFAHLQKIVHRDIKPNNLILHKIGNDYVPKIMDFGIARALGESVRLTQTGNKMGTLAYMSPEQCRAHKDIDHRTDIYSTGVSMYEMLSGKVPFDRDTELSLMKAIIEEPPPAIRKMNPRVPDPLENILSIAMKKEPSQRFDSAGLFSKALGSALQAMSAPKPQEKKYEPSRKVERPKQQATVVEKPALVQRSIPIPPPPIKTSNQTKWIIAVIAVIAFILTIVVSTNVISQKKKRPGRPIKPPVTYSTPRPIESPAYTIQLSSHTIREDAENARNKYRAYNLNDVYIQTVEINGQTWHRVRAGHFANKYDAQQLAQEIVYKGIVKKPWVTNK